MALSIRALAVSCAVLWGAAVLLVGLLNRLYPSYGLWFLKAVASVYPGYHGASGLRDLAVGVLCALADGAVCGALLAWLYNKLARVSQPSLRAGN